MVGIGLWGVLGWFWLVVVYINCWCVINGVWCDFGRLKGLNLGWLLLNDDRLLEVVDWGVLFNGNKRVFYVWGCFVGVDGFGVIDFVLWGW